ncbi:MAG: glucose-6-phosphate isomerase [Actinomycetia bacterium]|nr:glucose-6-phosphate isomerase [Actinomycetes bacterium]
MSVTLAITGSRRGLASTADRWRDESLIERVWRADPTVWAPLGTPEVANRLGWLNLHETSLPLVSVIDDLSSESIAQGITDIVLCGMGGSSLAPEVFSTSVRTESPYPKLTVLDSTHPDAVAFVASHTSPATTWYVIASKSGTTLETLSLFRYFWKVASDTLEHPGSQFVAITDPGSSLSDLAADREFRACIEADPSVGGRYSALTAYGLVPAGLAGLDVGRLLASTSNVARRCAPEVELLENPAFLLGATLATRARNGADKAQIVATEPVEAFPVWAEQLIAESTGKQGRGIIPIAGGPFPSSATDGTIISIGSDPVPGADIEITVDDSYDIAGAMFLFELATAIAGEVLGIQPFDQPDVQLAKELAASAMSGDLVSTTEPPVPLNDATLANRIADTISSQDISYVSIQAYLNPGRPLDDRLESLRSMLDRRYGVFTTTGYGPRFLHSTGQIHKGGPPGGVYVQLIDSAQTTMPIPETDYSFNELIAAQALGDRTALAERGRSVISIDLGSNATAGITNLIDLADTLPS